MFVTQLVLIAVILIFLFLNIKNRYASVIALYLASVAFTLFIATIYISKLHYYNFPLQLDYILYLKLSTLHISISQLATLYNLSFALFMFSSVYGAKQLINLKPKYVMLLSVPIFLYLFFTSPSTAVSLYVYQHTDAGLNNINLITVFHTVCKLMILFYTVFPYYYMVKFYLNTKFKIKRHNCIILSICITIVNIYFHVIFIFVAFKSILFCNINPAGLPLEPIHIKNYMLISIVTYTMVFTSAILLMIFKPFNLFYFEFNKNKDIANSTELMYSNLNSNLHMYKNMFWGARQQFDLIKTALQAKDYDAIIEYADDGIRMANQHFEQLQHTLNAFSTDVAMLENVNIVECMENAISKSKAPFHVNIIKDYEKSEILTYGNKYILTEAFSNLIVNSIESFENSLTDEPTITIKIQFEDNICMTELTDNGCGIPQKDIKKIFDPFYSTKSMTKNSGIGLNFVRNIIKSYHGTIAVFSKVNKYTTFQITIPVSPKGN